MKKLVVAALLVAVAIAAASPSSEAGRRGPAGPNIASIEFKSRSLGFAVGAQRVFRTVDGGTTWQAFRSPAGTIANAFFLDADHWWVAPTVGRRQLSLAMTPDGGASWSSTLLPGRYPDGWGRVSISFIDAMRGWVSVETVSGPNFPGSDVYRTGDGGATWERLSSAPLASIRFTTRAGGWAVGDVASSALYASSDAGATWERRRVLQPGGPRQLTVGLPEFFQRGFGVFTLSYRAEARKVLLPRVTTDGGATWTPLARLGDRSFAVYGPGVSIPFSAADPDHWFAASPARLYATSNRGASWQPVRSNIRLRGLVQIDFPTSRLGWALLRSGRASTTLLRTRDGGLHWRRVAFRSTRTL